MAFFTLHIQKNPFKSLTSLICCLLFAFPCFSQAQASSWQKHFTTADGLQNNQVRQIVELPNGQILVATEGVFSLYNGREFVEQPCNLDRVYPLPAAGGHSHLWQGDSMLWLKDFHSLYLYDAQARCFRYDYAERIKQQPVKRFIHEAGDSLTKAHVEALNPLRLSFDSLVANTPLHGEWLQAYIRDRQGGEWYGTQSGGLLYLSPPRAVARVVQPQTDDAVRRLASLDAHTLLMAGWKGVYLYDAHTSQVVKTLLTGKINCTDMATDYKGRVWISTQEGLLCYDQGTLQRFDTHHCTGFLHNHIRFALPLDDERLLLCNINHHLGYFYPAQMKFVPLTDKLPQLKDYRTIVAACRTDNPDKVMVCTQNGLFLLDTRKDEITTIPKIEALSKFSRKYNCILRDHAGRTWIGTQNGLLLMDNQADVRRITQADGLSNSCIQSLVEDRVGNLWVGTSCGINRISQAADAWRILTLGTSDLIPQTEMEERGACMTTDGTAYFISKGNIVAIPTQNKWSEPAAHAICLVGMKVLGKDIPADGNTLTLHHNQNHIVFQFSILNYAAPEHTRYRYRLHGIDAHWQTQADGQGLAEASYNAIPPGRYQFEAQAATGDGEWGTSFTKTIIIHPPLWLTWWAKLLYAFVLLAALAFAVNFYLKRRKAKLERENDDRLNQLFELRDEARHQFAQSVNIEPEKIAINRDEEAIVSRLMAAIEQNMDNVDYTVDQMASDAALSRTDLYRKMQQMLGITPNNFLRNVRLKHAAKLLAETDTPVNQVALMVGFQTPRYFSQCFRQMFRMNPSEYRTGESAIEKQKEDTQTKEGDRG